MRFTFAMAFLSTLTVMATRGKVAMAFVPAPRAMVVRRSALSSSSSAASSVSKGLRRQRPDKSGNPTMEYIQKMQKEKGLYRDFKFGHIVRSSDTMLSSTSSSATAMAGDKMLTLDGKPLSELPSVFPLQGKTPDEEPPRMRFAPSPTGSLHVGGARTALYNWLVAKKGQLDHPSSTAAFVLRVEDTDLARSTKESEESVLADLRWLGLNWDEGPDMDRSVASFGPYRQSERSTMYLEAAQRLLDEGKAYRCFCSPEELDEMKREQEERGEVAQYDGRWRDADPGLINKMMDDGVPYTIRFKVPDNVRIVIDDVVRGTVSWDAQATVGDFILLRSTGVPVYNFCVAVDDASMGITTVVRAEEHLTNTLRQALILDALGAPRPRYAHCSLILGEDKQKLSKRHGATSCDQYRLDGFLPDAMINYLALLGWSDGTDTEIYTRDELIDAFELNRVVKSPSVFDLDKLKWMNGQHIKMLPTEKLIPLVKDQLKWEDMLKDGVDVDGDEANEFAYGATALAKQMMETTKDAALNAKTVLSYNMPAKFDDLADSQDEAKKMIEMGNFYPLAMKLVEQYEAGELPQPDGTSPLAAFQDASGRAIEEDTQKSVICPYTQSYMKHMKSLAKEMKVKGRNLFHPVRLALTGEMSGQDVTKQLSLLSMATKEGSVIDFDKVDVVPLEDRMTRLREFCDTIPEEYRAPRSPADKKGGKKKETKASGDEKGTGESAASSSSVADPKDSYEGPPITALDIRVGYITKVWEHPEADKLYCEEIDVGEDEPRQVASGLRPYLKAQDMEGRKVLVLCNLKQRKMVGFPSHGMVLCASNADHTDVRLVNPPVDAKVGERVTVPDFDFDNGEESAPFAENKIGKKKIFEKIAPNLVTNKYGVPEFLGRPFMTTSGVCTSPIPDGTVS